MSPSTSPIFTLKFKCFSNADMRHVVFSTSHTYSNLIFLRLIQIYDNDVVLRYVYDVQRDRTRGKSFDSERYTDGLRRTRIGINLVYYCVCYSSLPRVVPLFNYKIIVRYMKFVKHTKFSLTRIVSYHPFPF